MHRQHPPQVSPIASPGAGEGSVCLQHHCVSRWMASPCRHRGQRPVCTNEHRSEGTDETPGPEKKLCLGNRGRRRFPRRSQAGGGGHRVQAEPSRSWPFHSGTRGPHRTASLGHFLIVTYISLEPSVFPSAPSHPLHSKPNWARLLVPPLRPVQPCQASKDSVAGSLVLSRIIEFTNSTFRDLTRQGICNSFKQGRPTTFPMVISLFTTPRYT